MNNYPPYMDICPPSMILPQLDSSYETNENSGQEYAGNKIQNKVNSTAYYTGHKGNQIGRKSFIDTKENIVTEQNLPFFMGGDGNE